MSALDELLLKQEDEISRLHLTIARLTEAHKEEMKKQIGYLQKKLDALDEKIESYNLIIATHNKLGGRDGEG